MRRSRVHPLSALPYPSYHAHMRVMDRAGQDRAASAVTTGLGMPRDRPDDTVMIYPMHGEALGAG
jgi:hypothetical protein